jgi:hydroxylaminobenzene mutase
LNLAMSEGAFPPAARLAGRNAAVLLLIGLVSGGYVSAAMTGKIDADPHMALAAHLNCLLGAFWLLGLGWSLPMLRFSDTGQARLVWLTTLANFANFAVTAFKALWKVHGIDATGEARNDLIFGLLTAFVVLPSLVSAGAWVYGFKKR